MKTYFVITTNGFIFSFKAPSKAVAKLYTKLCGYIVKRVTTKDPSK